MDIERVLENFRKNEFKAVYFETKEEACAYLDREIDGVTVSCGGSVTVGQINLMSLIKTHNEVYSHWDIPQGKTKEQMLALASTTDVYLTSANAATVGGELVNIDGMGNRVAGTLFGHKKVYFIVGINKFEDTIDAAIYRARNVAAPLNAKRLGRKTPCAVLGDRCYNCSSPERICRGLVVLYKNMMGCDAEVVIIGEKLGF